MKLYIKIVDAERITFIVFRFKVKVTKSHTSFVINGLKSSRWYLSYWVIAMRLHWKSLLWPKNDPLCYKVQSSRLQMVSKWIQFQFNFFQSMSLSKRLPLWISRLDDQRLTSLHNFSDLKSHFKWNIHWRCLIKSQFLFHLNFSHLTFLV